MDFEGAQNYIIQRLEKELPNDLFYHGIEHTFDVLKAAELYASMENVKADDLILLRTAALFHDCGFIVQYYNNENISVEILRKELPKFEYSEEQIERVSRMIMSTKIPQKPKNLLEKILCDADLDYLGRYDFFMKSIKLLHEWNNHGINTSLKEWYCKELTFLQKHKYFTKSAISLRQEKKLQYLSQIKELLNDNKQDGQSE
jgi:predicted metal-dependent HD superfamily phosphohydrolase